MRELRAMVLALVVPLVLSCTSGTSPETGSDATGAATPSASPRAGSAPSESESEPESESQRKAARVPEVPSKEPAALAEELDLAARTLRDPDATQAEQRAAGELQQIAIRNLATEPERFRRKVMARLDGETAFVTRAGVRAARVLSAMTTPQRSLPRWRIIAPPSPERLRGHYRLAQRRIGVHWSYLAAIHLVETRMGRIRGTSTAGARGPMQFLPATWQLYGAGGDINDPRDAVLAAARLLRANGAPRDMAEALYHYNPSDSYVRAVSDYARAMRRSDTAYLGYWHWRVLYRHARGTYVLPVGYPTTRAVLLPNA
jgi:membrane-bound lytic murein transglycosylase B